MQTININKIVAQALAEDIHGKDITTDFLVDPQHISHAHIIAKEDAVVCGLAIVKVIFKKLNPRLRLKFYVQDGQKVRKGDKIVHLKGHTRAILSGERVALNFLGYLSGISTLTHHFVQKIRPYRVKILDTRKTIPGLRALEKTAVRYGGGVNHRFNLNEMVLIKDNHRHANHKNLTIPEAIRLVRQKTAKPVEIEVDTLAQFRQALDADPDMILLDNMPPRTLRKAVRLKKASRKRCILEASGGVNLKNVVAVAKTGVDHISVGALTHSSKDINFSMEIKI